MNIKNILFKKKNNECESLILPENLIIEPDDIFYKENESKLIKITKEFTNILKEPKTITSVDLLLRDIYKDSTFYSSMLSKIYQELDEILDPLNKSEKRNGIDILIIMAKLKYYQTNLLLYKDNLFLQRKSLQDIRKLRFSKNKHETINSKITQIELEIVTINNLIQANELQTYGFTKVIENSSLKHCEDKEEHLENIYNTDLEYLNNLGKTNSSKEISITNIVMMESYLEEYTYFNESKILQKYLLFKAKPYDFNMNDINDLIIKLRIYQNFKNNQETKEYLKEVYKYKYDLIKQQFIDYKPIVYTFNTKDVYEKECFTSFLENDINIIKHSDELKNIYKDNYSTLISIVDELTKMHEEYKYEYILMNNIKLMILFNINNIIGLTSIYKTLKVSYYNIPYVGELTKIYSFEDNISLETVSRLYLHQIDASNIKLTNFLKLFDSRLEENFKNNLKDNINGLSRNEYYQYARLYKIANEYRNKITNEHDYTLYQGLTGIYNTNGFNITSLETALNMISTDKISMQLFLELSNLYYEMKDKKIEFNYELEEFNINRSPLIMDEELKINEIVINDKLKNFSYSDIAFDSSTNSTINILIDFDNSSIFENEESAYDFLRECIKLSNSVDVNIIDTSNNITITYGIKRKTIITPENLYNLMFNINESKLKRNRV